MVLFENFIEMKRPRGFQKLFYDLEKDKIRISFFFQIDLGSALSVTFKKVINTDLSKRWHICVIAYFRWERMAPENYK